MKLFKHLSAFSILILCTQGVFANDLQEGYDVFDVNQEEQFSLKEETLISNKTFSTKSGSHQSCASNPFGDSAFFAFNESTSYSIAIPSFPATTLLSRNRNAGFTKGDICLTPTGLIINTCGTYSINFSAIIQGIGIFDQSIAQSLLPNQIYVFLAINGILDLSNPLKNLGTIAGEVGSLGGAEVNFTGILRNVKKGTHLSLVATNTITTTISDELALQNTNLNFIVLKWDINLFKIAD